MKFTLFNLLMFSYIVGMSQNEEMPKEGIEEKITRIDYLSGDYKRILNFVKLGFNERVHELEELFIVENEIEEDSTEDWPDFDSFRTNPRKFSFTTAYLSYKDLSSLTHIENDTIFTFSELFGYELKWPNGDTLFLELLDKFREVDPRKVNFKEVQGYSLPINYKNVDILRLYFRQDLLGRIKFAEYFFENLKFSGSTYLIVKTDLETLMKTKVKGFYANRQLDKKRFDKAIKKWERSLLRGR